MKALVLELIRLYQIHLSPRFGGDCRFTPSCSDYAIQCVARHGVYRGLTLAVSRILRCRTPYPGGVDPAPLPDQIQPALRGQLVGRESGATVHGINAQGDCPGELA